MVQTSSSFNQLSATNKILAVLGTVKDPITQGLAITISGLDFDHLDPTEQAKVTAIFSSPMVLQLNSPEYGPIFKLAAQAKKDLTDIDWRTVQRELKNVLIKSLFQK